MKVSSFFVFMLCALLVAACTAAPKPMAPDSETAAPNTPDTTGTPTDDARYAFAKAMAQRATADATIVYTMNVNSEGTTFSGTLTQYSRGQTQQRTDTSAAGIETRTLISGSTITACFSMNSGWSCSDIARNSAAKQSPNPADALQAATSDMSYSVSRDGTLQVAGANTECYLVAKDGISDRICLADGVPLYMKTVTPKGTTELTATQFSRTVNEGDFVAPVDRTVAQVPPGATS